MKRYFVGAVVSFFFPLLVFAQTVTFQNNLYYGLTGSSDVTALQEFLTQQNVYHSPISGNFYSLTLAAVKKFQSAEKITPVSGYVGPVTRGVINQILAGQISNSEENATTTQAPVDLSQPFSTTSISSNTQKTIALPNGAVVVINADGSIASYTAPPSTPQSVQATSTNTSLSTTDSASLQISSVSSIPALTSVEVDWNTNIPTDSKVFLSGGGLSSQVYPSESGISTRHVVHITNLTSNTTYSYEIEAIAGTQDVTNNGSFTTAPDDLNLSVQVDKTSVQLTGWDGIGVTAVFTKNGKPAPVSISLTGPDASQTANIVANPPNCENLPFLIQAPGAAGGTCSKDGEVNFTYNPKSLGTQTITVSADGVSKSVNITVTPYVKVDPTATAQSFLSSDAVNGAIPAGDTGQTIGVISFTSADEPVQIEGIGYTSSASGISTYFTYGAQVTAYGVTAPGTATSTFPSQVLFDTSTNPHQIFIKVDAPTQAGNYTLTITDIKATGMYSGQYRNVQGLPFTFHYSVK